MARKIYGKGLNSINHHEHENKATRKGRCRPSRLAILHVPLDTEQQRLRAGHPAAGITWHSYRGKWLGFVS